MLVGDKAAGGPIARIALDARKPRKPIRLGLGRTFGDIVGRALLRAANPWLGEPFATTGLLCRFESRAG